MDRPVTLTVRVPLYPILRRLGAHFLHQIRGGPLMCSPTELWDQVQAEVRRQINGSELDPKSLTFHRDNLGEILAAAATATDLGRATYAADYSGHRNPCFDEIED